jgi:type IX secretion system PorP/SprF family membrane protein
MKEKILLLAVLGIFCETLYTQQMPAISLFDQNQTVYNPGAIGNQEVLTANFLYRKQWAGFEGSPSTQYFCAHAPLKNPHVAIGILLEHDAIGATNYTGVYFNYAYRIDLGMNKLSFGLKAGVTNGSQNNIDLRDDAPDPAFSENDQNFTLPNFGFGVSYYGQKYWGGFSIPKLFGYDSDGSDKYKLVHDFSKYEYFISGGSTFDINPEFSIDPSMLLVLSPRYNTRFTINAVATYKKAYSAGLGFRTSDNALILLIRYSLNRQFSLGYSYDLLFGNTAKYSSGSHEINLFYKFGYKVNAANPRVF